MIDVDARGPASLHQGPDLVERNACVQRVFRPRPAALGLGQCHRRGRGDELVERGVVVHCLFVFR